MFDRLSSLFMAVVFSALWFVACFVAAMILAKGSGEAGQAAFDEYPLREVATGLFVIGFLISGVRKLIERSSGKPDIGLQGGAVDNTSDYSGNQRYQGCLAVFGMAMFLPDFALSCLGEALRSNDED